jgi:hypothetical protein
MAIAALAKVPKGTVIKLSITLPGDRFDGLALTIGEELTPERAAVHLKKKLVQSFIDRFLPHEVTDA